MSYQRAAELPDQEQPAKKTKSKKKKVVPGDNHEGADSLDIGFGNVDYDEGEEEEDEASISLRILSHMLRTTLTLTLTLTLTPNLADRDRRGPRRSRNPTCTQPSPRGDPRLF